MISQLRPASAGIFSLLNVRRFVLVLSLATAIGLLGCGGGGGGGGSGTGTSPVGPTIFSPRTDSLKVDIPALSPGQMSSEISFARQQLVMNLGSAVAGSVRGDLAADTATVRHFGLVVTTGSTTGGSFRLQGNGGGGVVLSSIRGDMSGSMRALAFPNQALFDKMRNDRAHANILAAKATGSRKSLRGAVSTAGEKIGDSVSFMLYSSSGLNGGNYTSRTGVLRRIGKTCKLFVDPDAYNGLSATVGTWTITEEDLDIMMNRFDDFVYPLITQNYGPTYDMDTDGHITIVLSPLVTQLGFAGLFDTEHLETRSAQHPNSNERDMISVFTPNGSFNGTNWRNVALETTTHEFQHLANFVAHRFTNNLSFEEDVWLDESLAVGAEARYRILVGDTAGEDRFRDYTRSMRNTSLVNFGSTLANYGAGGLFSHYMYERAGSDSIKAIVNSDYKGIDNVDHVAAPFGGFQGILRDWSVALFAECHKTLFDYTKLDAAHRYKVDLGLNLSQTTTHVSNLAAFETSISPTSMSFAIIEVPVGASGNAAQLVLDDPDNGSMSATLIRLD
ncbi:MAG: hypothetical protein HQM09_10820 [Candidatus Riflebacteria bacterium]|nr:hypothetical protein [Candidatus Riflebacteria bacterium]